MTTRNRDTNGRSAVAPVAILAALAAVSVAVLVRWSSDGVRPGEAATPAAASPDSKPVASVSSSEPGRGEPAEGPGARAPITEPAGELEEQSAAESAEEPESGPIDSLDEVARTFLTSDPDLAGLDRVMADLALHAEVIGDSIVRDPVSGVVRGKIQFGAQVPEAEFEIDGDSYRVALTTGASAGEQEAMKLRTLEVRFTADSAGIESASSRIQYHPDTRRPASQFLSQGEEGYAGWAVRQSARGAVRVEPIAMRAGDDGVSWEIGRPATLQAYPTPWAAGLGSAQVLYSKLAAAAKQ